MNDSTAPATDLQSLLGNDHPPRWWQRRSLWIGLLALLLTASGVWFWQAHATTNAQPNYVTAPLSKGDLTLNVSANGTLHPTSSVNIGSELSSTVKRVLVDVNDRVKTGQVLVEIDTSKFRDQVTRSRASLCLSAVTGVPYVFNPGFNLLSFVFSAAIGVIFGFFPARRAARLDPIEALRHE